MREVKSKKTILVLDDDPSVRHMLQVLLEQQGHVAVAVGDVRSALAQCKVELPDLMIVDLMLPIEDGEMFLREFRRRWRHVEVPVIVLSASTARSDIARRLGAQATLAKPFFAEDLRELVALHVGASGSAAAG
jgi:DNA-binding response OmpR family regulator